MLTVDNQSKTSSASYKTMSAIESGSKDFLVRGGCQLELAASVPGRASVVLRNTKHSFTRQLDPIAYHINYEIGVIRLEVADITDPEFADAAALPPGQKVVRHLAESGGGPKADIMTVCGLKDGHVDNVLSKLRRAGKLVTPARELPGRERFYELKKVT